MENNEVSETLVQPPLGGLTITWLLADDPRTIKTKTGDVRTVIELRDPRRLSSSISIWLDGDGDAFAGVPPNTYLTLHLKSARSGKGRGELVGSVERPVVEKAFEVAREAR